jgi:O-antigen/teichoic acid export membrane protein
VVGDGLSIDPHLRRALSSGTVGRASDGDADDSQCAAFAVHPDFARRLGLGADRAAHAQIGILSARLAAHALLLWCAEPYIPRVGPSRKALVELRGFAGGAMGGQILHAISCNADYLLVGRMLGSSALGFYGMAWDLLRFVPDRLYKVAGRVTVPAFCRMQHEPEQLRRAYLSFLGYMSRLIVPPLACIAVAAPELLRQIYGPQWIAAALPLRILSIGIITIGLRAGMGAVYYALARPVFDMYLHGVRLVLIVIAVTVTASSGLLWVCAGVTAVEAVCSVGGQLVACRMLGVGLGKATRVLIPGFTTAVGCAAATVAGKILAANLGVSGLLELLLMIALPGAAFLLIEARTVREMLGGALGPVSIDDRLANPSEGPA